MVFGEQILLPVVLSPVFGLAILFVIGRVGSYVLTLHGTWREGMALILGSIFLGLLMWQILLAALVYRFWRAHVR